jgi:hypothetical protein
MPTLVHDCPHCSAAFASFNIVYCSPNPTDNGRYNTFGICPACGMGLCADIRYSSSGLAQAAGDLKKITNLKIDCVYPSKPLPDTPEDCPPAVSHAYVEGADCLGSGRYTAAAAMYRRCLEVALKAFSPDVEAWKLEKRIDKLAAEGRITKDLQTWAHRVRLDGNDALHEEERFTKEAATELAEFTRLLLIYLYTLPEKIKRRIEPPDTK